MDRLCDTVFDWDRIEHRFGTDQGPVDRDEYNFHLKCVEMYFKYFHGTRIVADIPFRMRKQFHCMLFISFIKRCFVITYARYYIDADGDGGRSEDELLYRFKIYYQFLPRLPPFDSYFS